MHRFEPPFSATLKQSEETLRWELFVEGSASGLLSFLTDISDYSVIAKIWEEAQFERIALYAIADDET